MYAEKTFKPEPTRRLRIDISIHMAERLKAAATRNHITVSRLVEQLIETIDETASAEKNS